MALPKEPVVKKFFTNKIESTRDDWYGYLVQIARIFYTLDGEEYNRDVLMNKFSAMSGRDAAQAQRDSSNFRDEFGAYGTYLGIYHLEQRDGRWCVFVSDAAKKFLCCQNPNAAAFCRAQLSLFQYPNGAGSGISANGGQSVQGNIKADTLREIQNGIRLNPLRLICKIVVGEVEIRKKKFSDIAIPYPAIFCMVNDSRINQDYNPPVELVSSVFSEYCAAGDNVEMNLEGLTNFKRNFHILEKTGLFTRDSKFGLLIAQRNYTAAYDCIKVIAEMDMSFDGFEALYDAPDENGVRDVISSPMWGQYYDAARIPSEILTALGVEEDDAPIKSFLSTADFSDTPTSTEPSNLELLFKSWLAVQVKANGELYSENTRNQYIGALKAVATQFADAIAPFASVFEITDAESFERAVSAIKSDDTYEEFNRSRGNGSLSAGLDLYKRFLLERNDTSDMFSPEWFREKAAEYPTLDEEANQLLADFQTKFAPEVLASLSGVEMLNTIFLNAANAENVCRILEFGPQIKDTFGSIKGGNAYKYGLYYSTQGAWMTGSHQKPRQLTEEEAIEVGTKLRNHLVAGANAIKEYGSLATIDDYKKLHQILREVTEGDIERVWFLKYYQMLYPELFATNYSDYAQRTVLGAIGEEKEKYPFVRMGQIRFYANKCGITNVMFNKIFWDYYSEETTSAKAEPSQDICYSTGYQSDYPRNRILFGAPGTGKSFTLNHEKDLLLADGGEYERVTFHPDYSYANFVGTYKPVPCKDSDGKDAITYSYVPGPFMRTYVKALQNSRTDAPKPFLLVIEEINRANVAAVFGDVFQLLDRGDDEVSEYPIQASEDIKKYLAGELGGNPDDYAEIRIPDNMFIWATMNSADQGVFPMDTAFKRRWDFTYLGIDDSEAGIVGKKVILGQGDYRRIVEWNALRKAINNELLTYKVNEDKLMGPYFISKKNLPEGEMIDPAVFTRIFKNKVIMYLFDDAAKQKRITLFGGCDEKAKNQYSKICSEFDTKGVYIFCEGISSQFIDNVPEDDGE